MAKKAARKKVVKKSAKKTVKKSSPKRKSAKPAATETQAGDSSKRKRKPVVARDHEGYSTVNVLPYFDKKYNPKALGSLTADKAKNFLGWREESPNLKFKKGAFSFIDRTGKKVRCDNNLHNRPFDKRMALDYMTEILRRKWQLNGESCIIDRTGMVQDAQHRMVGLVWAAQEWHKNPGKWGSYWETEPVMDTVVVVGINDSDTVVDTLNTGKRRSLSDALFRSRYFRDMPGKDRKVCAKVLEWAIRGVWQRTCQSDISHAPRMPHSEALDFFEKHPRLEDCVRYIVKENTKEGRKSAIRGYLPLGQASGLMYLMAVCGSDRDVYNDMGSQRSEESLSFDFWDDAVDFWGLVAQKSSDLEPLLESMLSIPEDAGGKYIQGLRSGLVIKAWNLYASSKNVTAKLIRLKHGKDEFDRPKLLETPICGGIDVGGESQEQETEGDEEQS